MLINSNQAYKKSIANYLKVRDDSIFLFWKGRVALYAILQALGVGPGDEVIIPAFTCVVVPNAILYLKAKPIYVDIDEHTYNIDLIKLEQAISPKTKVIIAQNTFGLSPDIDAIIAVGKKYSIECVEDCTHGMGGFYKNKPNGTLLKASFFSTQWNKPYSTGIGGMAYVNDTNLAAQVSRIEAAADKPSFKDNMTLRVLIWVRKNLINASTYWLAVNTYRWLSERNIITGSSQGDELEKPIMPKGFLKGMGQAQAKEGHKALQNLDQVVAHQRKVAKIYTDLLTDMGKTIPYEAADYFHSYLKYPILVEHRSEFMKSALDHKIELGEWFNSPIHPIEKNFEQWQYEWGTNPIAEKMSQHIINLPTGINIDDAYLERIIAFLRKEKDHLR